MDAMRVAVDHYRQRRALAARIATEVDRLWSRLVLSHLAESWAGGLGVQMATLVTGAQLLAAQQAEDYVATTLDAQGIDPDSPTALRPHALSGVASDGRPLASLLFEPIIAAKTAIGAGAGAVQALAGGRIQLDMIVRTQIADAGRVADGVAIAHRRQVGGYVRMLNPPSCSRCAILAGKWYRWNAGFQRHPRCDCTQIPAAENAAGDLTTSPRAYFDSLDAAEQDRLFTKAGAQAIRDGADIGQVVNARRGMYTAGGLKLTRESTSRSGVSPGRRLMPEQIYRDAAGSRDEVIRLLRQYGYIA